MAKELTSSLQKKDDTLKYRPLAEIDKAQAAEKEGKEDLREERDMTEITLTRSVYQSLKRRGSR